MDDPIRSHKLPLDASLRLVQGYVGDLHDGYSLPTVRVLQRHVDQVLAGRSIVGWRTRERLRRLAEVCAAHRGVAMLKPPKDLEPVIKRLSASLPRVLKANTRRRSAA